MRWARPILQSLLYHGREFKFCFYPMKMFNFYTIFGSVTCHWTSLHNTDKSLWDLLTRLGGIGQQTICLIPLRLCRCALTLQWLQGLDEGHWVHTLTPSGILTCGIARQASLQFDLTQNLTSVFVQSGDSFSWSNILARALLPWIFPSDSQPLKSYHLILVDKSFWPLKSGSLSGVISYTM